VEPWIVVATVLFAVILVSSLTYTQVTERRKLRAGHCGLPWKSFDTASDASIGTKCQICGTYGDWISPWNARLLQQPEQPICRATDTNTNYTDLSGGQS